jgi:hypothetical protein
MTLTVEGTSALASVDGLVVGPFAVPADLNLTGGFVGLGSGFHPAVFDDFFVKAE